MILPESRIAVSEPGDGKKRAPLDGGNRKTSAENFCLQMYCSLANTFISKANTSHFRFPRAPRRSFPEFNHLRAAAGLALRMPIPIARNGWSGQPAISTKVLIRRFTMFDGKNNRVLDSFFFRLGLTAAVFAVWWGASYVLLLLS
jgi:hypothetical protein